MYCPNCGSTNSAGQRFCRSCGLGLEKIALSLTEQLPTKVESSLQERKDKLERLGVAALSVFGVGVLGILLYGIAHKLIVQGRILAGLTLLGLLVILGSGILSVILFAKAKELKEASGKRRIEEPPELSPLEGTRELLPKAKPDPMFSVTDRTTELLAAEKRRNEQ